jgi:hypothetical protein
MSLQRNRRVNVAWRPACRVCSQESSPSRLYFASVVAAAATVGHCLVLKTSHPALCRRRSFSRAFRRGEVRSHPGQTAASDRDGPSRVLRPGRRCWSTVRTARRDRLSDDPAASFSRISVVLARMGDAHDIAEIARRLAGLAPRQLVDLDPEVLGQEFADDHGLAEKLGAVAPAGVSPSPRARRQCRFCPASNSPVPPAASAESGGQATSCGRHSAAGPPTNANAWLRSRQSAWRLQIGRSSVFHFHCRCPMSHVNERALRRVGRRVRSV